MVQPFLRVWACKRLPECKQALRSAAASGREDQMGLEPRGSERGWVGGGCWLWRHEGNTKAGLICMERVESAATPPR